MDRTEKQESNFGLIGRNIAYSFSRGYFKEKFERLGLDHCQYVNFDIPNIADFPAVLENNPNLAGLNVTIPYKEAIIPFLKDLDPIAADIMAVNTIQITSKGLKGYNTDVYGFEQSLLPLLKPNHQKALILGTGGASKAIAYVLRKLNIDHRFVSRKPGSEHLKYEELSEEIIGDYHLIINCTPLGTWPDVEVKPPLPYAAITSEHLLFDLIYNPEKTAFLKEGAKRGATITNGLKMLELQADRSWEIWNS